MVMLATLFAAGNAFKPVSFRDAAKMSLLKMDPGLPPSGWLETLDRDYADGDQCKHFPDELGEMRNVYSCFDDEVHPIGVETMAANGKELTVARFERMSRPVLVMWFSGERPGDSLAYERVDISNIFKPKSEYVWTDLMTGRICKLEDYTSVPLCDSPVMISPNDCTPRRTVWAEMTPAEIVDALYRPNSIMRMWMGDRSLIEMDVSNEPWTKMPTKDFLPCFDKYGQFKYREWPGKTHSDEELKAVTAEEEKDLAAHPGP